ncbi:MAG: carboxypeptidase-like regulatory domain-containing protein [Syntrophothermus sp.]
MKQAIKLLLSLALVLAVLSGADAEVNAAGPGTVSGRVLYNGQGISGIKVYLVPEAEVAKMPRKIPDARVAVGEEGLTDPEGRYTITGVPEGSYRVYIFDEHAPEKYLSRPGFWGEIGEEVLKVVDAQIIAEDIKLIAAIKTQSPQNGEVVSKPPVEFRWEPCLGAASYTLSIFDPKGKLLHEEKGLTAVSRKTLFSWALGGLFAWQVTAYNDRGEIIGQSLFPPEKRPVFLLGRPNHVPALLSLTIGESAKDKRIEKGKRTFSRTDERVVILEEWAKVDREHVVVVRFYTPRSEQYHELRSILSPAAKTTWQWIDIAGHKAAEIPGKWQVKIWVNDQLVRTDSFEIIP